MTHDRRPNSRTKAAPRPWATAPLRSFDGKQRAGNTTPSQASIDLARFARPDTFSCHALYPAHCFLPRFPSLCADRSDCPAAPMPAEIRRQIALSDPRCLATGVTRGGHLAVFRFCRWLQENPSGNG